MRRSRTLSPHRFAPVVALFVLALAVGCATNPVTGKKELSFVSESQEIEAGRQSKVAVAAEYGTFEDRAWSAKVDSLGKAMARRSHRPDLPWEFTVLDDATVNAFAAPGGYIYITRGILAYFNNEAQLAGVVGHEIGHVTARHYNAAASREQLAGIGLLVGSVVSETVARYGQTAQQGLGLLFLKYGRDQENESDRLGVDYSIKAGYDPREMPGTYAMLSRISASSSQRLPTYLSTHPDPAAREATVRDLAATQVGARTDLIVNRDGYLRRLDGMVFGNDPRHGYFEAGRFYHPELAFTMDFPQGWQTQNARSAVVAVNESQKAAMQLTLVDAGTLSPTAYVQKLGTDGSIAGASGGAETIGGYAAWTGRIAIQDAQGQKAELAMVLLRKSPSTMFRILGQVTRGSAAETAFLASARSFRALTDATRLSPTPARIDVVAASQAGTFGQVVGAMGAQGLSVEQTAILNGVRTSDPIARGRLIKIVLPAKVK